MNMHVKSRDRVCWLTAAPLWDRSIEPSNAPSGRFQAPALLRFRDDGFMDVIAHTLASNPAGLAGFVARAETWRHEDAGWEGNGGTGPVTLYQPVHNRFYLATASLVCQRPGLPDRKLDVSTGERAFLVLRRLVPRPGVPFDPADPTKRREEGWVGNAQSGRWVALDAAEACDPAEERLPMFPLPFREGEQPRRLHAGLIPVARANTYANDAGEAPASAAEAVGDPLGDPRLAALSEGVLGGLGALAGLASAPAPPASVAADQRFRARSSLVLALLDLGVHLERENPALANALRSGSPAGLSAAEAALRTRLTATAVPSGFTVAQAIVRGLDRRVRLEANDIDNALLEAILGALPSLTQIGALAAALLGGSPDLRARLTAALIDPRVAAMRDLAKEALTRVAAWTPETPVDAAVAMLMRDLLALDDLLKRELPDVAAAIPDGTTTVAADAGLLARFRSTLVAPLTWGAVMADARARSPALYAGSAEGAPLVSLVTATTALAASATQFFTGLDQLATPAFAARPLPATPPAITADDDAPPVYVLRSVYERPKCAGIHPPTVSAPSRPFRLAGFFDPDAPVRKLKIEMPAKTSIADFRKAPKGVAIRLSRELRSQISRVRGATLDEPLDGQLGGGSFNLGVICSLSIPIITICALILLMIIVQLLNIVFWWIPFFITCLPVRRG